MLAAAAMVQGAGVLKGKKNISKLKVINRHGKTPRMRKGRVVKPPVKAGKRKEWEANRKITKMRAAKGLATAQAQAQGSGDRVRLSMPPILAPSGRRKPVKTGVESMVMK